MDGWQRTTGCWLGLTLLVLLSGQADADPVRQLVLQACGDCHAQGAAEGGLDLDRVGFDLAAATTRERFALMHDRVANGQMPPDPAELPDGQRQQLLARLEVALAAADREAILAALADQPQVTCHVYPDVGHAFARVTGDPWAPQAAELANARTLALLRSL